DWLPIFPRDVIRLHEPDVLIGFGPGGTTAVVGTGQLSRDALVWEKVKLLSVPDGEVLATLPDKSESLGHSVDARIWVFRHEDSCVKFDAVTHTIRQLSIGGAGYMNSRRVTADGRLVAVQD